MVQSPAAIVHDVDLLILGGGCAGLSLAWKLSRLGSACPRVLILEKRTTYTNDRTWCFWDGNDSRIADLVAHEWRWLNLTAHEKTVRFDCGASPYQMLEASTFYDRVITAIGSCSAITLALGESVDPALIAMANGWTVGTGQHQITARWVVDTRPAIKPIIGGAILWQSFYGHEVFCERQVFTPDAAELMDFTQGVDRQIVFNYVLPVSQHRALIELTVFGPAPLGPAALLVQLDSALSRYTAGSPYSIVRSESGILPMGLAHTPSSLGPGHVAVGVMAGGARASSGFAFQRIQQWADQCAAAIAAGGAPTAHRVDPLRVRLMDRLFLQVLRSAPQAAPALFLSLFERADSASVIRFLSGRSTLKDCFRVVKALPAKHFLRQLFSSPQATAPGTSA